MKKLFLTLCAIFLLSINVFSHEDSNGYIVKLKENISLPFTSFSSEEIADTNLNASLAAEILSQNETEITEIYAEKGLVKVHDEQILSELTEMDIVEYAEKDLICEFYDYTPEDNPYYSNQWGISAVKAPFAWSVGAFGKGVRVAVIDSGCNAHKDLEGNILPGANFFGISDVGTTPTGDYSDNLYHGTFVSGIIAAKCNNIGIMGIAPKVKIVPLKISDASTFKLSYVIPAIYAAVDYFHCDVINMSLGASTYDPKSENGGGLKYDANGNLVSGTMIHSSALSDAIAYAVNKGCIVVASSGNDGERQKIVIDENTGNVIEEIRHYSIPASIDIVISVANAEKKSYLSYDIASSSTHNEYVDVAAPGTSIYSLSNINNGYRVGNGTSFSSPHVAAVAALMKSIDSNINQRDFNSLIRYTSDDTYMTSDKGEIYWGNGLLNTEGMIKFWLSRNHSNGYLSEIYFSEEDYESSVWLYNSTSEESTYTIVISNNSFYETVLVSIPAASSKEISLSEYNVGGNVSVSMYKGKYSGGDIPISTKSARIPYKASFCDLNFDGIVDNDDVNILAGYLVGAYSPFSESMAKHSNLYTADDVSDTSELDNINVKDLIELYKYVASH